MRTRKRAVEQLLKVAENHIGKRPMTRLSVIHAAREEEAQALLAQAIEQFHPQEIHTSLIGVVLGVHTGPGALGLVAEYAE